MAQIRKILNDYTKSLEEERILLIITLCLAAIFYFLTLSINSTYDDNLSYIDIGKELAETGKYTGNFWNRPPLLPSIVSVMYLAGFDITAITIMLPLAFILLFLSANFYFIRTLYDTRIAFMVTWVVMAFPSFWRWSGKVLADAPFGAFAIFSLLFFYMGIEKDRRYLIISSVFFAASFLTKILAAALVPIFLVYLIYRRKWGVLREREFGFSLLLGITVPAVVMGVLFLSDPGLFSLESVYFAAVPQGQLLMLKFILNPLIIFVPLGLYRLVRERKREHVLVLTAIVLFILLISRMVVLMRYITVIYGMIFLLSVYGLMMIRSRPAGRHIFNVIIIGGIVVGLLNSAYLMGIDSEARYGVRDTLIFTEQNLGAGSRIAAGNLAGYLKTYGSRGVMPYPYYVDLENETVMVEEFNSIVTDPGHELHDIYVNLTRHNDLRDFYYFDDAWLDQNNVTHVIWSIYDEFLYNPQEEQYNIEYSGIEIPVKRAYISLRPPPGFAFSSDLYKRLETSSRYERVWELDKGGREVIIIYKFNRE